MDGSSFKNPKFGAFKFQPFDSIEGITSYVNNISYGTQNHPSICFGLNIIQNSNNSYELDLIFND